jgi:tripartite-type tricarboxylate transporter receptor subunit TctC
MIRKRRTPGSQRASRWTQFAAAGLLLMGSIVAVTPARSSDVDLERHFKGKTVRLVVDFKPGGGTDIQARYLAAHLGKFIPGNPRITVTNLFPNPAGQSFVWKSAPDGLTLSFLANAGIGRELADPDLEFKTEQFTWIGSHAKRDVIMLVRGDLPYNSLADARNGKTPIRIAETIGGMDDVSGKLLGVALLAKWFDLPLQIANVARLGSSDALVMLERGDVNGYIAGSHWYSLPTLRPGWFSNGYLKPLLDLGHPETGVIPNSEIKMTAPNVMTYMNEEQRKIWSAIYLPEVLTGKAMAGPPKMPPAITKALRDAYAKAMSDPEVSAQLTKLQGQPVALIRGERMQELVTEASAAFKESLPVYNELRKQVYDQVINR